MSLIYSFIQTEYTQIFNEKGLHHQKKKKQTKETENRGKKRQKHC